ncbi:MAG: hypothetical protein Q4D36_11850, partial [Bacteroidales bacterium]|nr:hypothetical protein [Bacteroidales bacterium]
AALAGEPTVEFVNEDEALKYVRLSGLTVTPKKVTEITEAPEKVEIPMNLIVKDVWGMTMKVPFTVTIQTTEPEE